MGAQQQVFMNQLMMNYNSLQQQYQNQNQQNQQTQVLSGSNQTSNSQPAHVLDSKVDENNASKQQTQTMQGTGSNQTQFHGTNSYANYSMGHAYQYPNSSSQTSLALQSMPPTQLQQNQGVTGPNASQQLGYGSMQYGGQTLSNSFVPGFALAKQSSEGYNGLQQVNYGMGMSNPPSNNMTGANTSVQPGSIDMSAYLASYDPKKPVDHKVLAAIMKQQQEEKERQKLTQKAQSELMQRNQAQNDNLNKGPTSQQQQQQQIVPNNQANQNKSS